MILIIEGFEAIGGSSALITPNGKFTITPNGTNLQTTTGRKGGLALTEVTTAVSTTVQFNFQTSSTTMVVGIGFQMQSLSASGRTVSFFEGSNEAVGFGVNSNGALTINRGTTNLYTGSAGDIVTGTWYYMEMKVVINDTTGSVLLKKDGSTVTTLTNVDTKPSTNAFYDSFRLAGVGTNTHLWTVDDLYILDGTGSANNDILGPQRVVLVQPISNGDTTQWTPNASSNYDRVDDSEADGDTTYVADNTSGHLDLYNFSDNNANVIAGIQINAVTRGTETGINTINLPCKSAGTTSNGSTISGGGPTYSTKKRIMEQDPHTSAAWTNSGLKAAQFGIKIP